MRGAQCILKIHQLFRSLTSECKTSENRDYFKIIFCGDGAVFWFFHAGS